MIQKLIGFGKNRVVKNAAWLIAGKVFQVLINLLVGLLTARYLGPANYGLISYAQAFTTFFASFCTLGINSVIVKELLDDREHEGRTLGTAIILRLISSVTSVLVIVGISSVWDKNEPVTQLVVGLYSIGLIFQVFEMFNFWFQSRLQSKVTAMVSLAAYTVMAVYKTVLLVLQKPVTYFALSMSVDYLCVAALLSYFYFREGGARLSVSWRYGKSLLRKSCPYILSGLMVAMYAQTDKIMLKHMISEAEIGYYSTALSICNVWCFLLNAIITSMAPVIMQAHKTNYGKYKSMNRLLYAIVIYMSVFVSLLFVLLGDWIIPLLYGTAYYPAVMPLKILTWQTAFSYLGVARDTWIVCENKQKYLKYIYCSAAAANVVLNFLLIPRWGASGAAMASLIAQIVTVFVAPFFIREMRENSVLMVQAIFFKGLRWENTPDER